jgi:hypothetical protein
MASASYTFTHVSNSVFTTRIDLQDASPGVVNYQVYFIRSTTAWTSYNLNTVTNRPNFNFALGGSGFSGFYTYDFRNPGLERLIGSGSISVTAGATLSLTGTNDPVGSMGIATASGSFTTVPVVPVFGDSTVVSTANVGTAYSDEVTASGSPTYSVRNVADDAAGVLPTGLALTTTGVSAGAITGTPTAPGVFSFRIKATNVSGSAITGILTITVLGGGKVWNGTAFVAGTTRVWNGTAFVSTTTKVWDGSAWVSST